MNEPPFGRAVATEPLGRVAATGFGRVGLAGLVLVLAAVVVTMSGGAGLGGKLGSLFGLRSQQGGKPAVAIQVAAPAPVLRQAVVARAAPQSRARSAPRVRLRSRRPAATGPQRTQAPSTQPAPAPAPVQPPPVAPKPPPAPSGNVQQVSHTVSDTAGSAAPPAQPVLDQTTTAVDQACGLIGGCP